MAEALPRLRPNLDVMPSPVADRPGLLLRDPYRYSEAILVIPPPLVPFLALFDGHHSDLDLREALFRATGEIAVGDLVESLVGTLRGAGFLEDDAFESLRATRHRQFAEAPHRDAVHAGSAYPAEEGTLRDTLDRYLEGAQTAGAVRNLIGIAAPHVSPEGGFRSYGAGYGVLDPEYRQRTFVILGTSHYGEAERFGLTRKPFRTPAGEAPVETSLVDFLAEAGPAAGVEDYCQAVEHSVEFQVVFLQHLYGPDVRILPILCGPFARATHEGGSPEDDPGVARFLAALRELATREAHRLFWILGVDMAHVGRRYGDASPARADAGEMLSVARQDRERIDRVVAGDAAGFWGLVQHRGDPLRWCGASPLYAFLRAVAPDRGELLRYEQWNIDEDSVVSFGGLAFFRDRSLA